MNNNNTSCSSCPLFSDTIFQHCNPKSLSTAMTLKNSLVFKKGDYIIEEGKEFKGIYCINQGLTKIVKSKIKKDDFLLWFAKKGEPIGLRAFIHNEFHTYSAVALTETNACFIPEHEFRNIINENPQISIDIMKALCKRIHFVEGRITNIIQKKVEARLAEFILAIYDYMNFPSEAFELNYELEDLANISGTTKNYAYKVMIRFAKAGLIEFKKNKLKIINADILKKIATGDPVPIK